MLIFGCPLGACHCCRPRNRRDLAQLTPRLPKRVGFEKCQTGLGAFGGANANQVFKLSIDNVWCGPSEVEVDDNVRLVVPSVHLKVVGLGRIVQLAGVKRVQ